MRLSKRDDADCREIAKELGIDVSEVRRAVCSYFDMMNLSAKALPFDNKTRIFDREVFEEYEFVIQVPYLGRFGPSYSKYLKWRANAAKDEEMLSRGRAKHLTDDELDTLADKALSGQSLTLEEIKTYRKRKGKFNRVWLVGKKNKRLAGQVIMNKKVK